MNCCFLGSNSPRGFYSLYDELLPYDRARGIYLLKGGPGCGKSTFMRRVADAAGLAGLETEYILCSGDPDSLDAVVIPERGIALVDGTAPHVREPKLPGAVDHYIDLGRCYRAESLAALRGEITAAMEEGRACYDRAYRCLSAAAALERDRRAAVEEQLSEHLLARRLKGVIAREFRGSPTGDGLVRRRFLSAVTCRGEMYLWDTVTDRAKKIYVLEDSFGLSHRFLSPLLAAATAVGFSAVVFPSPMEPERVEHLLFPDLSLAFVTSSPGHPFPGKPFRRIRMDTMLPAEVLRQNRAHIRFSQKVSDCLLTEAVSSLAGAKAAHDRLEAIYHPHVDFDLGARMAEELIGKLGL